MTIASLNPWHVLDQLHQDPLRRHATGQQWQPPVDIRESQDHYAILLDLPGVVPAQVQVELDDGILKIAGEKNRNAEEGTVYRHRERTQGTFGRHFRLPDNADANRISARFDNGVLTVTIQKQEIAKPRRIEIQGG